MNKNQKQNIVDVDNIMKYSSRVLKSIATYYSYQ